MLTGAAVSFSKKIHKLNLRHLFLQKLQKSGSIIQDLYDDRIVK